MHIDELRKIHDELCIQLHPEAVRLTNDLVDKAYVFFNSNSFNFSVPASRNIYQSRVYFNILNYLVVTHVWKSEKVDITVDSKALRDLLQKYSKENGIAAHARLNWNRYSKDVLKIPVRFFRVLTKMLCIRRCGKKISCSEDKLQKCEKALLIDTDLLLGAFGEKGYSNRSFGAFFDFLSPSERKRTFIVPRLLAVTDFKKLKEEVKLYQKSSGIEIFCKESNLSRWDYFRIIIKWMYPFALGFRKNQTGLFQLISEELRLKAFSEITFESFVSFYFMKQLKTKHFPIDVFLIWNENHLYDRAYSKSFSDFKLPFRFVAYQGVVLDLDYDFYIEPTKVELSLNLFPKTLFAAGKQLNDGFQYGQDVQVNSTPVFRFNSYLTSKTEFYHSEKDKKVIVGLSLVSEFSEEIMRVAVRLAKEFPEYEFKIRCHPLSRVSLPKDISNMSYDNEKNVIHSLKKAVLFIGTGSSLVLEAGLMRVPALIVRKKGEYVQNPMPKSLRSFFTAVVTQDSDLRKKFLEMTANVDASVLQNREKMADLIYSTYVEPIGRESFEALIG